MQFLMRTRRGMTKMFSQFSKRSNCTKTFHFRRVGRGCQVTAHIVPPLLLNLLPADSLFLTQLHGIPELCLKFLICTTLGTQSFLNTHSYPRQSFKCGNWPTWCFPNMVMSTEPKQSCLIVAST